jgi:hypothetical protein
MPDDPISDAHVRTRLDDLVPPVDVDAAWPALERRLRQDRRRRSVRLLATAAAVVVVLVAAGIGVNARRSTDPSLDVADAPPPTGAPAPAAAQLQVTCDGTAGSVVTPVVEAGPGGVDVAAVQGGGRVLFVPLQEQGGEIGGIPLDPEEGPWVSPAYLPGSYDVRCGPVREQSTTDVEPAAGTVSIGTLEVVDPGGYYTFPDPGLTAVCTSTFTSETYESSAMTPRELTAWRLGAGVRFNGYRDQQQLMIQGEGMYGMGDVYYDGRSTVSLVFCGGSPPPLPPGDGLAPSDPLRTDADAIAWLTTAREAGDPNARIPKGLPAPPGTTVTITDQSAKLVRQDETGTESQARSVAPGFAVWFVRVGYVGDDGIDRVAVFSFSPAGDPRTVLAYGDEPPPPGRDWAAWFDALPDHAA